MCKNPLAQVGGFLTGVSFFRVSVGSGVERILAEAKSEATVGESLCSCSLCISPSDHSPFLTFSGSLHPHLLSHLVQI